jgi:hypothetical protein
VKLPLPPPPLPLPPICLGQPQTPPPSPCLRTGGRGGGAAGKSYGCTTARKEAVHKFKSLTVPRSLAGQLGPVESGGPPLRHSAEAKGVFPHCHTRWVSDRGRGGFSTESLHRGVTRSKPTIEPPIGEHVNYLQLAMIGGGLVLWFCWNQGLLARRTVSPSPLRRHWRRSYDDARLSHLELLALRFVTFDRRLDVVYAPSPLAWIAFRALRTVGVHLRWVNLFKVKCLFPPLPLQPRNYRCVALARSKPLTTTVSRLLPCYV